MGELCRTEGKNELFHYRMDFLTSRFVLGVHMLDLEDIQVGS